MFRKSLLACGVSLALLPNVAGALGLGGIRTQTALNEPFAGQIDLLDVNPEELDAVKVSLASEAEFNKAGAPRIHFLTTLKFQPQVSSRGRPVIWVSGSEPVREPYLDFLVEVNWPNGRLVKEFTVLLDPPVTSNRRPPQVERPALQRPPSGQFSGSSPPSRARLSQPPASVDTSAFPMRHGPVEPGAGLWRIAQRMAPATGATVAQTAMALYRNNQQAFIRGDINKLKVNEVLEIPTAAELFALDTGAAEREFGSALRGRRVTSTPLTDISAAPEPQDRLEIAGAAKPTPTVQPSAQAPSQAPSPEEQTEGESVAGETRPVLDELEQDLLLVQEAGESTRQETEELRGRIQELEAQLADVQRLLELSNERFAQLEQAELERSDSLEPEVAEAPLLEAETPDEPGEEPAQEPGEGEGTEPGVAEISEEPGAQEPTDPVTVETPDEAAPPAVEPPGPDPTAVETATEPEPVAARPFWESIPQPLLALALALPLLFVFLMWMVRRRRKSLEETFEQPGDFRLAPEEVPVLAGAGASPAEPPSHQVVDPSSHAPSIHSEFADLEEETDEGDVVSEADVYIAYGRYREAETLLEEEIERSPDRLDIKYKLAEAYYGARNVEALEALREQMAQSGGDQVDPDKFNRLSSMVRDLKGDDTGESSSAAVVDAGPTLTVVDPTQHPAPSGETAKSSLSMPASAVAAHAQDSDLRGDQRPQELELDVEDLELLGGGLAVPEDNETLEMSGATSDLELQLEDLDSLKDMDLSGFPTSESPDEVVSSELLTEALEQSQVDSLDIAPDSEEVAETQPPQSQWRSESQWQLDSGIWDEVATKMDLARAYVEMEDPDAARVILEEVVQEGTEDQRAAAREMMAQIG